ncbi:MAG: hypothetical protein AB7R00_12330 [Kofleriaceae bacterium]
MARSLIHGLVVSAVVSLVSRTWVVVLIAGAVCAMFASRAIAAFLAPIPVPSIAATDRGPPTAPARHDDNATGRSLVARNMFCSACDRSVAAAPAALRAELIATLLGATPRATLRVQDTWVQGSWGLGDVISGLGRVDRISGASIEVIDTAGQRHTLSLRTTVAGPRDAGAATPATGPATAFGDQIIKLDHHTYRVDRTLVAALVSGTSRSGAARAIPVIEDGALRGIRLALGAPRRPQPIISSVSKY